MAYTPINDTGLIQMMIYANQNSDGIYGIGVLAALYIIIFINLKVKGAETTEAFFAGAFIAGIMGVMFFMITLISSKQLFIMVVLMIIPLLWSYFTQD